MKIPESIRIAGVEYPVEYVPNLRLGDDLCFGTIDYRECKIQLSSTDGLNHDHRCITLIHEILHGIRNNNGMEIEDEENVVDMFARGLYQVLQDNEDRLFDTKESV